MLNTKGENMKNLSTGYTHTVYVGNSLSVMEGNCWTFGWCANENLEDCKVRKHMKVYYTFNFTSEQNARQAEAVCHAVCKELFGKRANVVFSCSARHGDAPNRSDEWWYAENLLDVYKVMRSIADD